MVIWDCVTAILSPQHPLPEICWYASVNSHSYYELDEHIRPLLYICHPCVYQYNFYANLKLMPEELFRILDKFNIPHDSFNDQPAQHDTRSLMPKYFLN